MKNEKIDDDKEKERNEIEKSMLPYMKWVDVEEVENKKRVEEGENKKRGVH